MATSTDSQGMPPAVSQALATSAGITGATSATTTAAAAAAATTVRVHVTQFDRSERPNPSPKHVRSAVLAATYDTGVDTNGRPTSALLPHPDDKLCISQPSISMSSSSSQASRSSSSRMGELRSPAPLSCAHLEDDLAVANVNAAADDDDDVMPLDPRMMREKDLMWPSKLKTMTGITDLLQITFLELRVNTHQQSLGNFGSYLPALRELKLNGSSLRSLRDVGTCLSALKVLGIADCALTVLDGLIAMPNLEELYAAYNLVSDLNALMAAEQLRVVDLEENCVDDIGQIGCLALSLNMVTLTLAGNPLCTRPTPSDPDPTPGYDYAATVRRYIPGLKTLDDIPLGAARPSTSLHRPRPGSARQRPATATGGRTDELPSSDASVARRHVRPMSARGATNVSKLTESMRDLPLVDEGRADSDDDEDERRAVSASGRQSSLSVVGEALVGNPTRALRRLHQQQRSASAMSHGGDVTTSGGAAEKAASPLAARKATSITGATRPRDASSPDSAACPRKTSGPAVAGATGVAGERDSTPVAGSPLATRKTSGSEDADRRRLRDQRQRHSESREPTTPLLAAAILPVMADTRRQRADFLDDLRQWRETFDAGESLLQQTGELSPVKDGDDESSSSRPGSRPRDSNPVARARRQLPKTPSVDGMATGGAPRPPAGPRPDNIRTARPLTARASLQLGVGGGAVGTTTTTTTTTTPSKKPSRRPKAERTSDRTPQQRPEVETLIRVSTDEQERQRARLRGGAAPRPSTAAAGKSGYLP